MRLARYHVIVTLLYHGAAKRGARCYAQHYSHDCESTMASAPEFPAVVQSYADRIKNDYPEREYVWFLDVLRGKCPAVAILPGQKPISTIRIVDDMGTTSRSEYFDAPKDTDLSRFCRCFDQTIAMHWCTPRHSTLLRY